MDNQKIEGASYWQQRQSNDERKDWRTGGDWISEYWDSINHPHRKLILSALERLYPFDSLLEIGCASGPNLKMITDRWSDVQLSGIDLNKHAIEFAQSKMPWFTLKAESVLDMEFAPRKFDIALCDASLMYVEPKDIKKAMDKINEVADHGIVICDFDSDSVLGIPVAGHWGRDYSTMLAQYGFSVDKHNIAESEWPSKNWYTNGALWVASR